MTDLEYLEAILASQTLEEDSEELKTLQAHHDDVVALLRANMKEAKPSIRYSGSYSKGTMIKNSYDLDIACYVPHDNEAAGETLAEIHATVKEILDKNYTVHVKTTALRLEVDGVDYHIDVVPGRFIDEDEGDVYLHRTDGAKKRLKTNLDVHVEHIGGSGVRPAIRLMKLWRDLNGLAELKTFVLELAVVELLKEMKDETLTDQLKHVLTQFRDAVDDLVVEDPANPTGNDLSPILDAARPRMKTIATATLETVDDQGWQGVFGDIPASEEERESVRDEAIKSAAPNKPWRA